MADIDDKSIINEALARIGAAPIFALDEESKTANKVSQIYPTVVGNAFECHRWHFARRTALLDRLAAPPLDGWLYAYALPGDRIGPPVRVLADPRYPDFPLRRFTLEGGDLHCDAPRVYAVCVRAVEPRDWPFAFRLAVVLALAADFCVPLTHDTTLSESLRQQAWGLPSEGGRGGAIGRAMARDEASASDVAPLGASSVLTEARYDGPWHGGV